MARYRWLAIDRLGLEVGRVAFTFRLVGGIRNLAAALDQDVPLITVSTYISTLAPHWPTYLECILSREALVALCTGKRLDRQVDPLVALEIMVTIEALRALIAFEWSVVRGLLLMLGVTQEMRNSGRVPAVEALHHPGMHTTHQRELPVRVIHVRKNRGRTGNVVPVGSLVRMGRRRRIRWNGRDCAVRHGWRHSRHGATCTNRTLLRRRRAGRVGER